MREFRDRLSRRAHRAGLMIPDDLASRLEVYYRLLSTWNAKINLTSFQVEKLTPEALDRLLIEPLAAARYTRSEARHVIDIGSGGGSPAIPFALAGASRLMMVEVKSRKAVFLREAIRALEMTTWDVTTARWEDLLEEAAFREAHDILTVRAVRLEQRTLARLSGLMKANGEMFLFGTALNRGLKQPPLSLVAKGAHTLVRGTGSEVLILGKHRG